MVFIITQNASARNPHFFWPHGPRTFEGRNGDRCVELKAGLLKLLAK
jgi:hypothetical protein